MNSLSNRVIHYHDYIYFNIIQVKSISHISFWMKSRKIPSRFKYLLLTALKKKISYWGYIAVYILCNGYSEITMTWTHIIQTLGHPNHGRLALQVFWLEYALSRSYIFSDQLYPSIHTYKFKTIITFSKHFPVFHWEWWTTLII